MKPSVGERLRAAWRGFREPGGTAEGRLAGLEMDLQDRDEQIARLREEFAQQARQSEVEVARAAANGLESLAKAAAPLLSQLSTLRAMADAGREVRAADLLKLADKIKRLFLDAGLEPLGQPGEVCTFDTRVHQRLSGGDVQDGDAVKVRFEGYRLHQTVISKAMVSREAEP